MEGYQGIQAMRTGQFSSDPQPEDVEVNYDFDSLQAKINAGYELSEEESDAYDNFTIGGYQPDLGIR